jgi:hypothetical protein
MVVPAGWVAVALWLSLQHPRVVSIAPSNGSCNHRYMQLLLMTSHVQPLGTGFSLAGLCLQLSISTAALIKGAYPTVYRVRLQCPRVTAPHLDNSPGVTCDAYNAPKLFWVSCGVHNHQLQVQRHVALHSADSKLAGPPLLHAAGTAICPCHCRISSRCLTLDGRLC